MQQIAANTQRRKVIVGLGRTGLSCARYLHFTGEEFAVVDSRDNPPGLCEFKKEFPDVYLELGEFRTDTLCNAAELIISPGVSLREAGIAEALSHGVPVHGDVDIFSRSVSNPIVGITGSNGKSTVVSIVGDMVRNAGMTVSVGGNLDGESALPVLDMLRQPPKEVYVLELSSFQLETTQQLNAEVAVILNLSEDHMDRYASTQEYLQAKQRIFYGCRQIVVNRDDSASIPPLSDYRKLWSYGCDKPATGEFGLIHDDSGTWLACGEEKLLQASQMKLLGRHNASNALAALALGHALGLPRAVMLQTLREFPGLPHRCQWLKNVEGVDYYNDSKGTNPGATIVAIQSLGEICKGALVLIAGGIGKDADFTALRTPVAQYVHTVVLLGRDAHIIAAALHGAVQLLYAADMQEAVQLARISARSGDAVLLSPACASFDMFNDFMHRGRVFAAAVEAL